MTFQEEIKSFTEPYWGVISNDRDPAIESWDNPLLFTAQYYNLTGEPIPERVRQFCDQCISGGLVRWPGTTRPMSQDEVTGLMFLTPEHALRVFHALPDEQERFQYLIPWILCAMGRIPILDQIVWALDCVSSTKSDYGNTSGKCLFWVQLRSVKKKNYFLCNLAIAYWQKKMTEKYPGGVAELFGIYFPGHPLGKYAPKTFEI